MLCSVHKHFYTCLFEVYNIFTSLEVVVLLDNFLAILGFYNSEVHFFFLFFFELLNLWMLRRKYHEVDVIYWEENTLGRRQLSS